MNKEEKKRKEKKGLLQKLVTTELQE